MNVFYNAKIALAPTITGHCAGDAAAAEAVRFEYACPSAGDAPAAEAAGRMADLLAAPYCDWDHVAAPGRSGNPGANGAVTRDLPCASSACAEAASAHARWPSRWCRGEEQGWPPLVAVAAPRAR